MTTKRVPLPSVLSTTKSYLALYRDPVAWNRCAILNVAGMGWFSADRTIGEYVDRVWSVKSLD